MKRILWAWLLFLLIEAAALDWQTRHMTWADRTYNARTINPVMATSLYSWNINGHRGP